MHKFQEIEFHILFTFERNELSSEYMAKRLRYEKNYCGMLLPHISPGYAFRKVLSFYFEITIGIKGNWDLVRLGPVL